jgi:hypothetical protein
MASQVNTGWAASAARSRVVWIGVATWVACGVGMPLLTHGVKPFDRPNVAAMSWRAEYTTQMALPAIALVFLLVTWVLTRRRNVDVAARAPERQVALRETLWLLAYGAVVLLAGEFVGHAVGTHAIGMHLAGSMFGLADRVTPAEAWWWAGYNFVFYAAIPYVVFRRRGYSNEQLCLKSSNLANDTLVIVVILAMTVLSDLPLTRLRQLTGHQLGEGAALAFVISLLGTGLPILVFLCAILAPRYRRLTGSAAATCVLSGFTYAALHFTEYWTRYNTPSHAALSVMYILTLYGGPGMVKGYLTQRTGNAWVHLWAYHAIAPHVTGDTPVFVKIFGLK